jgi:hypothetical protein
MPLPFSGQCVKLAITGGLLRYFEDLPFGCEVWCSVAAIGPLLYVSVSAQLRQEVTTCAIISPCRNFCPLPDFE